MEYRSMGETSIIDHELLINSILEQNGIIVGGYVRAWVSNGHPSNNGWQDIDCIFPDIDKAKIAIKNIKNLFGENSPEIDLRSSSFGLYSKLQKSKLISLQFNTFYCSCWKFDGKIELLEPAKKYIGYDETLYQTKNKIAKCIMPFQFYKNNPRQIAKMLKYGWVITDHKGNEIPKDILLKIVKNYKSTLTLNTN